MFETPHAYRTTFEYLSRQYCRSAQNAFNDGNYVFAAQIADNHSIALAKSYIMFGYPEKGLELLEGAGDVAEAHYYRAVAHWLLGDREKCHSHAKALRSSFPDAEGIGLLQELIGRDRVNILVMNREFDLANPDPERFRIVTAGFSPANDIPLELEDSAETLMSKLERISFRPDFLFAYRPEYQLILKGLESLPFPKIAFITDYDSHLYQKFDDFDRFDMFVVFSGVEHFEVARLFDKPVFTHILTHSVPGKRSNPESRAAERRFDIHVTGSSFRSFFADKSSYFYALTQLDRKYSIRIDDGFLSTSAYHSSLEDTRFVPTYVRFYGGLPTRGVEAIACGARVLYPEGGMLELFLKPEEEGIHPYRPSTVKEDTARALSCGDVGVSSGVSDSVSRFFNGTRTIPMFLRFCALIALFPGRTRFAERSTSYRDDYCVVGIDDLHGGIGRGYTGEGHSRNFDDMLAYNQRLPAAPRTANSCAILQAYHLLHLKRGFTWCGRGVKERLAQGAIEALEKGCRDFNNHLVLHFNLARFHFHFGKPGKAEEHFRRVAEYRDSFDFDPVQDDVLSALFFFEDYFPYRLYINELAASRIHRRPDRLREIIASSAAWYLALIAQRRGDNEIAIRWGEASLQLFPDNYMAQKWLSEVLLSSGQKSVQADRIIELFENSARSFIINMHKDILDYVELLISKGREADAEIALSCWYRFFSRVRRNGLLLPIDRRFLARLLKHADLLPQDARDLLARFEGCVIGDYSVLTEMVEELIVAVTDFSDRDDLLRSDLVSGRVRITFPSGARIVAQKLLGADDLVNAAVWYARHLWGVFVGQKTGEKVVPAIEAMECAAEFLQKFPLIYRLARQVRLRLIS